MYCSQLIPQRNMRILLCIPSHAACRTRFSSIYDMIRDTALGRIDYYFRDFDSFHIVTINRITI